MSKRMLQENILRQIFRKTNIPYPHSLRVLFSFNTLFEIRPFTLLPILMKLRCNKQNLSGRFRLVL